MFIAEFCGHCQNSRPLRRKLYCSSDYGTSTVAKRSVLSVCPYKLIRQAIITSNMNNDDEYYIFSLNNQQKSVKTSARPGIACLRDSDSPCSKRAAASSYLRCGPYSDDSHRARVTVVTSETLGTTCPRLLRCSVTPENGRLDNYITPVLVTSDTIHTSILFPWFIKYSQVRQSPQRGLGAAPDQGVRDAKSFFCI